MNKLSRVGRGFFAVALLASGLQQLLRQDFVRLVPKSPQWIAGPSLWAGVSGLVLIVVGLAIVMERKRSPAARVLGVLFGVVFLLYLPGIFAAPGVGFMWTNPCKTLALLGGAILVAVTPDLHAEIKSAGQTGQAVKRARLLCAVLFGGFLVVCGVQHFVYADFVAQMVPAWLPGHRFWTYFTGIALISGGVGVNFKPASRLAALGSGAMIFLWIIFLHLPRALANRTDAGETSAIFEALALCGIAFLLAGFPTGSCAAPAGEPLAGGKLT